MTMTTLEKIAEIRKRLPVALVECTNASFDCGECDPDDQDTYHELVTRCAKAKADLTAQHTAVLNALETAVHALIAFSCDQKTHAVAKLALEQIEEMLK